MRLTLRTLLAWLDGVLPGEEHAQLGEKVSASQTASMLAERIRVAVTRRAISAPAPDARGLADDANSVADFLDNTLSVDQLAAFEKICIDSEMHLAEVAACHAMLAEMASNPEVNLTEEGLLRIKQAVRGGLGRDAFSAAARPPDYGRAEHLESRETARALRAALGSGGELVTADGAADQPPGLVDTTGDVRSVSPVKRSSRAAWLSALVAASLLLALLGVLAWSVLRVRGRRADAVEVAARAGGPAAVESAPLAAQPAAEAAPEPDANASQPDVADKAPIAEASRPAMRAAVDGPPAAAPAEPVTAAEPAAAAVAPPAMPAAPLRRMEPAIPVDPVLSAAGGTPPEPPQIVVNGGTLLRLTRQAAAAEWRYAAAETAVEPGDELLVPPWSEATVTARGVAVRLLAQTYVVFRVDRDGLPRADILYGRAVVGGNAATRIGITTGGVSGVITADPATRVAIEATADRSASRDAGPGLTAATGFITGGSRPFVWQPTAADGSGVQDAAPMEIAAGAAVAWRDGRAAVADGLRQPAWLEGGAATESPYPETIHKFASAALSSKLAEGRHTLLSLKELADDRSRVEQRVIAAATLALLGESDELVELLAADSSSRKHLTDTMWRTLERLAVPAALARGGEAAAGLHQSFVDRGPDGKGELLWAMARGFSDAELAGGADRILVESLDDPHLVVRRYAFKSLSDIVQPSEADVPRYRPDWLPDVRDKGVAWWKEQLTRGLVRRRNGGAAP